MTKKLFDTNKDELLVCDDVTVADVIKADPSEIPEAGIIFKTLSKINYGIQSNSLKNAPILTTALTVKFKEVLKNIPLITPEGINKSHPGIKSDSPIAKMMADTKNSTRVGDHKLEIQMLEKSLQLFVDNLQNPIVAASINHDLLFTNVKPKIQKFIPDFLD